MRSISMVCVVAAVLAPASVKAQSVIQSGGLDLQLFKPTKDNIGFLTTSQTGVLGHLELNGNIYMNYVDRPLEIGRVTDDQRVEGIVEGITTLDAALTLGLFDRASISLGLPVTVNQDRSGALFDSNDTERGVNDIELTGKVRLLERNFDTEDVFGIGLLANIGIPTGDEDALFGAGGAVLDGVLLVDVEPARDLVVAANLGYRFRADEASLDDLTFDDQVTFKLGAGYRLRRVEYLKRWEVMGEIFGSSVASDLFGENRETPVEALAGIRRYTDDGWIFNFGVGAGLSKGVGAPDWRAILGITFYPFSEPEPPCPPCPQCLTACEFPGPEDVDGFEDDDGCPDPDNDGDGILDVDDGAPFEPEDKDGFEDGDGIPDPDNDGDGVLDEDDKCRDLFGASEGCPVPAEVTEAVGASRPLAVCADPNEDLDGFEDGDGCADPDNDRDGILDVNDKCPLVAEDIDAFEDDDGCPEKGEGRVSVVGRQIAILDNVYFETASDRIDLTRSEPILNDVATVLLKNPWILKLEVQGHTDDRGSAEYNLDLSTRRAAAVLEYLVEKGVGRDRLVSEGYGEAKPRQLNRTAEGRASNRRVEFVILEREGDSEVEMRDSKETLNDE